MSKILGVGIVGASPERGWAKESHVPAIKAVEGLELAAVLGRTKQSADDATKAFGAKKAYDNLEALLEDSAVDIVAVSVKAPDHLKIALAALKAKKHLYVEWPLGSNLSESKTISDALDVAQVHGVIGLQTRLNPVALKARELIASGAIGRVLSARVFSTTKAFGPVAASQADLYMENPAAGVTPITIQGAHTIDFVINVLGPVTELMAQTTTQYPEVRVEGESLKQKRVIADHLSLSGRLESGAPITVEVVGGYGAPFPFRLEVTGEKGTIAITGGGLRGFQSGVFELHVNSDVVAVPDRIAQNLPETAVNVAQIYAALRDDIIEGTAKAPDFAHAVRLAKLIDDILDSAKDGIRKYATDWPQQR